MENLPYFLPGYQSRKESTQDADENASQSNHQEAEKSLRESKC